MYYGGNIPWIKSGELKDNNLIETSEETITKSGFENSSAKLFPKGTILIAMYGATVGKTGILGIDATTNQAVCAIFNEKSVLDDKFLLYYLRNKRNNLIKLSIGGAQPNISQDIITKLEIPLPPLNEQKRIATKIEELFSELDYCIENLQKTRLQLKEYKKSILMNAFNGSLTINWRETHGSKLEKVTEILKKILKNKQESDDNYLNPLQGVETLPKLPSQWIWIPLGILTESMKNGIYKPKSSYANNGVACLRMYNIDDGELVWKDIKRMNLSKKEISEYELLPNDLLVNRVNSRELVGKTARIPEGIERCVYESKNIRLRLYGIFTSSILVTYWFQLFRQTYFNRNAQQTVGMASINQEQLSQMPIPYMHMSEQNELVKQIESHFTMVKNLLSLINVNLTYVNKLRNSILKTAFEGKLVPQDPNDESASVLLERINRKKIQVKNTR